ncbi:hypothetical protein CBM2633_B90003 [Cupriavidus taiwanensis]|nr:hypothetical protein CBM2633_B90003 [Cupriavidus taiwanensis]
MFTQLSYGAVKVASVHHGRPRALRPARHLHRRCRRVRRASLTRLPEVACLPRGAPSLAFLNRLDTPPT